MKISDEMAEAACKSFFSDLGKEPTGGEDELRGFMRAAIEAAVGDLVLVPREATDVQLDAVKQRPHPTRPDGWRAHHAKMYARMIAAHTQAGPVE